MSRVFLIFAAALVALMAGALFYAARLPVQQTVPAPDAVPATVTHPSFTLPDIAGTSRDFSEWAGKSRIVNFWATWCAPCRKEIPLLKAFQKEHGDNGFQVIGIAVDFPEAVVSYAEAAQFNYPVLIGEQDAMTIAASLGVDIPGLPLTLFVASDGEFLSAYIGELHQAELDEIADVMSRLDRREISRDKARAALKGL